MKYSVLLPTRNRLEYLRYAIETVLRQDYEDWEIVISDNASEDDIVGYVKDLGDPRVKVFRTEEFLPVTDNWNRALSHSQGQYLVMLGDDDGLAPDYFARMNAIIEQFSDLDMVYSSAYFFAYPNVMPDDPDGFLRRDVNQFFSGGVARWLDRGTARGLAAGYLGFRMPVASNMQFSLVKRSTIERLSKDGDFYKSPYPDFYATPLLFLKSEKIVIEPSPMVIIGITPKSYGFFHFNDKVGGGVDFLNNRKNLDSGEIDQIRLPGTSYNDSWLLASKALEANFAAAEGLTADIDAYRRLQIIHCTKKYYLDGRFEKRQVQSLFSRLTLIERVFASVLAVSFTVMRWVPGRLLTPLISRLRRLIGQHAIPPESVTRDRLETMVDVYDHLDRAGRSTAT